MSTDAIAVNDLDPRVLRRNVQMLLSRLVLEAKFVIEIPPKFKTQQYHAWLECEISHEMLFNRLRDSVFEIRSKNQPLKWFSADIEDRGRASFFSIRFALAEPIK